MPWLVHLAETTSGQVGRALAPSKVSAVVEINKAGDGSVTVAKRDLEGLDRRRLTPWWGTIVVSYVAPNGAIYPIQAGPIQDWPTETRHDLTIGFEGIRAIFERRHLEQDHTFRGIDLGTIAWRVVQAGMQKPGGALPIVHGSPDRTATAQGNDRTYEKWNIANNNVDKRLTEISEVIGGPDIMFRPRWANRNRTAIEWAFVHGAYHSPAIPQDTVPHWDATTARSDIASLSTTTDGTQLTSRVWGTGAGEGEGTTITKAEDPGLLEKGYPFLETVISDPDQAKPEPIRAKCAGELAAHQAAIDQLSIKVNAASARHPLGTWHVGNDARITTGPETWSIPPGTRTMRILRASTASDEMVTLELQEGQWLSATDLV